MFKFDKKTILIISPNNWGKMHISKHHYAIESAKRGNEVFFMNPPNNIKRGIFFNNTDFENIISITYSLFFPYKLRFHFRKLFDFLMRFQIRKILKKIGKPIDLVWCFDFNLFANLNDFKTVYKIYHPVDPVTLPYQINPAKTADIVFSVSEKILSNFKNIKTPSFFINHGIDEHFENYAERQIDNSTSRKKGIINAGYIGNLTRPIIDESITRQIIEKNKNVTFHFWGPYELNECNLGEEMIKNSNFISFLKSSNNVILHGVKSKSELVKEIEIIDIFFLIYLKDNKVSDRSNSHKLIEYICTGKVTVANRFETYINQPNLIMMPENDDDSQIPELFSEVIKNIHLYNNDKLQKKRIQFALNNTYSNNLLKIEDYISKYGK